MISGPEPQCCNTNIIIGTQSELRVQTIRDKQHLRAAKKLIHCSGFIICVSEGKSQRLLMLPRFFFEREIICLSKIKNEVAA